MSEASWASREVAGSFVDGAYPTVKGYVRTYVMQRQLLEHLPPPPAPVLDVGGGAGHQSFPLAELGYDVTLLDESPAMLDKARQRVSDEVRDRVTLVRADGLHAAEAVGAGRFAAVLCHGVLGYLDAPGPMLAQLSACAAPGGVVSVMTANSRTMAVRPAMERRWEDALAGFDATAEVGVLGLPSRADTVEEVSRLLSAHDVEPQQWYGVWLFVDLLGFAGTDVDMDDAERVAAVELAASRSDPYRAMSRVFHLVGRKRPVG